MNTDIVHVRNTKTGKVGTVTRAIFDHPVFNKDVLVEVEAGAKPVAEGLNRSQTATEYRASHPKPTPDTVDSTDVDDDPEDK